VHVVTVSVLHALWETTTQRAGDYL